MLNNEIRNKIFLFYLITLGLILINFNPQLIQGNKVYDQTVIKDYESCTITTNQLQTIKNSQFIELRKTVSVIPEINNLKCLGKVINFEELGNNQYLANVAVSNRITVFVENLGYIVILLLSYFFKRQKIWYIVLSVITLLFLDEIFYINNSLSKIFFKILLIILLILSQNYSQLVKNKNYERISFRKDINVLRAIAVISVIFYHAQIFNFTGGWLGVDIFFVISGYLISNIIFSDLSLNKFSLSQFYQRRIKRIFPALYVMLAVTFPVSYLLLTPKGMFEYLNTMKYSIFFLSNHYLKNVDLYTAEPNKFSPLLHTWSLSVEEQYYLIFPIFIIFLFKRHKYVNYLLIVFFISLGVNLLNFDLSTMFYLFPFRAWELLLGVLIMIINTKKSFLPNKKYELPGLLLIIFSVLFFNDAHIFTLLPKTLSLFGVALLLLNIGQNKILLKLSENSFINLIGLISYSLYLYHQPIYAFLRVYLYRNSFEISLIYHIFALFLIFIFSVISYYFVEKKFQLNFSLQKKGILFFTGLFSLLVVYFGIADLGFSNRFKDIPDKVKNYSVYPTRYPGDGSIDDWKNYDCNKFIISGYETIYENDNRGPCLYEKEGSNSNFLLIGDSHANTLSVAVIYNGEKFSDNYNFIPINATIGRCLLSAQNDDINYRYDCSDIFFNSFLQKLNKNDVVAVIGRFPVWISEIGKEQLQCNDDCSHLKVIENRLSLIASKVKKIIIIYPVPTHPYNVAESYFFRKNIWGNVVSSDYARWREESLNSYQFLDNLNLPNSHKIITESLFCYEEDNTCIAATKDTLYYADTNHLTIEGNELIIEKLINLVNK